ncbi:TerC family protein [bacterium]|nr:TerC family protein [bacterium]
MLTILAAAAAVATDAPLLSVDSLLAFLTLAMLEIVLGIDNIVVIAIVTARLSLEQQPRARLLGLGLAMVMRIVLLLFVGWIMKLTEPLFTVAGNAISGKDLILLGGGLFLIGKATHEIHHKMEGHAEGGAGKAAASFRNAILQILALDLVFSLDSVITAVGMSSQIPIMIAAIIVSVIVMMIFSGSISGFIGKHPSIKILALSFLLLIGVLLTAEGLDVHMDKKYIYFAMGFSLIVELINIKISSKKTPAHA